MWSSHTGAVSEDHISRPTPSYTPLSEISKGNILSFISEHFFQCLTCTLLTLYFFLDPFLFCFLWLSKLTSTLYQHGAPECETWAGLEGKTMKTWFLPSSPGEGSQGLHSLIEDTGEGGPKEYQGKFILPPHKWGHTSGSGLHSFFMNSKPTHRISSPSPCRCSSSMC